MRRLFTALFGSLAVLLWVTIGAIHMDQLRDPMRLIVFCGGVALIALGAITGLRRR